jgi:hypothetical protein
MLSREGGLERPATDLLERRHPQPEITTGILKNLVGHPSHTSLGGDSPRRLRGASPATRAAGRLPGGVGHPREHGVGNVGSVVEAIALDQSVAEGGRDERAAGPGGKWAYPRVWSSEPAATEVSSVALGVAQSLAFIESPLVTPDSVFPVSSDSHQDIPCDSAAWRKSHRTNPGSRHPPSPRSDAEDSSEVRVRSTPLPCDRPAVLGSKSRDGDPKPIETAGTALPCRARGAASDGLLDWQLLNRGRWCQDVTPVVAVAVRLELRLVFRPG